MGPKHLPRQQESWIRTLHLTSGSINTLQKMTKTRSVCDSLSTTVSIQSQLHSVNMLLFLQPRIEVTLNNDCFVGIKKEFPFCLGLSWGGSHQTSITKTMLCLSNMVFSKSTVTTVHLSKHHQSSGVHSGCCRFSPFWSKRIPQPFFCLIAQHQNICVSTANSPDLWKDLNSFQWWNLMLYYQCHSSKIRNVLFLGPVSYHSHVLWFPLLLITLNTNTTNCIFHDIIFSPPYRPFGMQRHRNTLCVRLLGSEKHVLP